MKRYLRDNMRYPSAEKQAGTTGKAVVAFTVTSTGKVTSISVQRELHQHELPDNLKPNS